MMGKYEPLARFLDQLDDDFWTASFEEIESKLGFDLPPSAHKYPPWWSNERGKGHSQKEGWQSVGWKTSYVNLRGKTVRFERNTGLREEPASFRQEQAESLDDLVRRGMKISGIENRDEILRTALTTFIQREAGRQLALMGGTMPNLQVPARERPPYDRN